MTLLEQELAKLPRAALDQIAASGVPETAAAAQAELDSRPIASAERGEAWIREVFPPRPDQFA
jgi:hypothetical protein